MFSDEVIETKQNTFLRTTDGMGFLIQNSKK